MRTLLLIINFLVLISVVWLAQYEWPLLDDEKLVYGGGAIYSLLNLSYIAATPGAGSGRVKRFWQAWRSSA